MGRGEHTPLACGFRRLAENTVSANFFPSKREPECATRVWAGRPNQHAGRVRSPFPLRRSGWTAHVTKNHPGPWLRRCFCFRKSRHRAGSNELGGGRLRPALTPGWEAGCDPLRPARIRQAWVAIALGLLPNCNLFSPLRFHTLRRPYQERTSHSQSGVRSGWKTVVENGFGRDIPGENGSRFLPETANSQGRQRARVGTGTTPPEEDRRRGIADTMSAPP